MKNATNNNQSESAQTFLVKTYQKLILTPEEKEMDIFDVMEKHFPINKSRVMPLSAHEMTYEQIGYIYALGCELDMYDAVTNWLTLYRNRADAEKYISYLEEKYVTLKQVA